MSLATIPPTTTGSGDDFDEWEQEFTTPAQSYRPSRAAERREAQDQIDVQLGIRRHRTGERES
ncbi:hypothetical protein ACWKSP_22330 [Micromonosporaceae bacterium Da 78-11]